MRNEHVFSQAYTARRAALLRAVRREDAAEAAERRGGISRAAVKVLAAAAALAALTVGVYAAVRWVDFRVTQDGDTVHVHASLPASGAPDDREEKPLRSWRAEDGEISVSLQIPDLPADMREDPTANGKYRSEDASRSMTVNGIDLRRSALDQIIGGVTDTKQLDVGGKAMYVVEKGEADYYNRIAYVVFDAEELVLKLWVSFGITADELSALASTMTLAYTADALLAIPIQNALGGTENTNPPEDYYRPDAPVREAELVAIGQPVRDAHDRFTVTVEGVEVYDNLSVLDQRAVLRWDFVRRFTDAAGKLIPYNRTEMILTPGEDGRVTKSFGETVTARKQLYVVTLTVEDVTMDDIPEADRADMLRACVAGFSLYAYTAEDGVIRMQSSNDVVDRTPNAYADSSEIIYRAHLGGNRWAIAYLIDEAAARGELLLYQYTGEIRVKLQ